ncbi:hypothetical protein Pmani_028353, partial [Petrolisthes manimaculis]
MAPRVSHLSQNHQQVPTATNMKKQSGGIRRKTPPRVCTTTTTTTTTTTNLWYSLRGRSSPSSPSPLSSLSPPGRVTPPRGRASSTPRSSPSRQLLPSPRLVRKMIQLWSAVETGDTIQAMQLKTNTAHSDTNDIFHQLSDTKQTLPLINFLWDHCVFSIFLTRAELTTRITLMVA